MKKLALAALLLSAAWTVSATEQNAEKQNSESLGSLTGVVESTDADHIAAVEARARQLEAKQMDNYEPTAAGHRKHAHKNGGKHHHKKSSHSTQDNAAPAQ